MSSKNQENEINSSSKLDASKNIKKNSNEFDEEKGLLESDSKPILCYQYLLEKMIDPNPNQLDCDAYLLASVLVEGGIKNFFLFVVLVFIMIIFFPLTFIMLFCKRDFTKIRFFLGLYPLLFLQVILIILIFFILSLMIAPAIFTIITQFVLIQELEKQTEQERSESLYLIKILLITFYFLLALKECTFATEAIGYKIVLMVRFCTSKIKFQDCVSKFLTFFIFFMAFIIKVCIFCFQIFISFYLSKINLILIYKEEDLLNLIQNFAALTILLDLDNIIILFLRYIGIIHFFQAALELFGVDFNENQKDNLFENLDFGSMVGGVTKAIKDKDKKEISVFIKYILSFKNIDIILKEEKYNIPENLNKFWLSLCKVLVAFGGLLIIFRTIEEI